MLIIKGVTYDIDLLVCICHCYSSRIHQYIGILADNQGHQALGEPHILLHAGLHRIVEADKVRDMRHTPHLVPYIQLVNKKAVLFFGLIYEVNTRGLITFNSGSRTTSVHLPKKDLAQNGYENMKSIVKMLILMKIIKFYLLIK